MRNFINIISESVKLTESRNVECEIIEYAPGKWYYAFERFEDPDGKYNWRDHDVDCYGPFPTAQDAEDHLVNNNANPGGHTVLDYAHVSKSIFAPQYDYWVKHAESPIDEAAALNQGPSYKTIAQGIVDLAKQMHYQGQIGTGIKDDHGVRVGLEITVTVPADRHDEHCRRILKAVGQNEGISFKPVQSQNHFVRFDMFIGQMNVGTVSYGQGIVFFEVAIYDY